MSQHPQPKARRRAATTGHAALAELTPQGLGRAELLLRRAGAVELGQDSLRLLSPGHATAEALASDLLRAGALPSAELLGALQTATPAQLAFVHEHGLQALERSLGAQPSLPQLAAFAATQVIGTPEHYLHRLAAFAGFGTEDTEHCALRHEANAGRPGTWGTGDALVSTGCAVGRLGTAVQGSCEICHFRVGEPSELLSLSKRDRRRRADRALPSRRVTLLGEMDTPLLAALRDLAGLSTPLSDDERTDLVGLLALLSQTRGGSEILRETTGTGMPQREVRALVLGTLLRLDPQDTSLIAQLQNDLGLLPVDFLRVLDVMGGGDGTLGRPLRSPDIAYGGFAQMQRAPHLRLPALSRPLRRAISQALERLLTDLEGPTTLVWEGVYKYAEAFKRLFAALHLHESARYPRAAALAHLLAGGGQVQPALPMTPVTGNAARTLLGDNPRMRTLMGQVEIALASDDLAQALNLLQSRPGLLGRLADRLVREEGLRSSGTGIAETAPLTVAALCRAASHLTPAMLTGLHAHFERRDEADPHRAMRAKGNASTRTLGDTRSLIARPLITQIQKVLFADLVRRAAALPSLTRLAVSPDVLGLRLSASARAASGGNEGLAAGSRLRLTPTGTAQATHARLFLHWAQREGTGAIDLDLSALAYNAAGVHVATCSFHNLRTDGMVHSGDLRSAPLPVGATEYIDLNLDRLRRLGVQSVVASVVSYTSVPFDQMARAACGVMSRTQTRAEFREMDPATARTQFGLRGTATSKVLCALLLNAPGEEELVFIDREDDRKGGYLLAVHDRQHDGGLALAGRGEGVPLTLLLAAHAARTQGVQVGAGAIVRETGEADLAFALRVLAALQGTLPVGKAPNGRTLHVLDQGTGPLREGDLLVEMRPGTPGQGRDPRTLVSDLQ